MRKSIWAVCLLVVLIGVVGLAENKLNLTPKVITTPTGAVYLFSNNTGNTQTRMVLALASGFTLKKTDIVAFGGGEVTAIHNWGAGLVAVDVTVVAGGTLQIALAGTKAASAIPFAWFALK